MNLGGIIGGIAGAAGSALGPLGAAVGGGISSAMQGAQMERMSRDQMNFQDTMSRTQYQRAVADMQAAGLNPMLAYSQGGNVSPTGAMGGTTDPGAAAVSAYSASSGAKRTQAETMPQSLLQKRLEEEIVQIRHQQRLTSDQADKVWEEWKSAAVEADIARATREARTKAELAEYYRLATEARTQGEITEGRYGTWLRYIDRAMDLFRGIIGGASAYSLSGRGGRLPSVVGGHPNAPGNP